MTLRPITLCVFLPNEVALAAGSSRCGRTTFILSDENIRELREQDQTLVAEIALSDDEAAGTKAPVYNKVLRLAAPLSSESVLAAIRTRADERAAKAEREAAEREERIQRALAGPLDEWIRTDRYGKPGVAQHGPAGSYLRDDDMRDERISARVEEVRAFIEPGVAAWQQAQIDERARREAEKAEREAEKAEKEAVKVRFAEERDDWISDHGSERLRRCLAEGIECTAAYRDERLEVERPGWEWLDDTCYGLDDPRNPPADAFELLDKARLCVPEAKLRYYVVYHECDEDCDHYGEDTPEYEETGYVAVADFLGRRIVLNG